MDTGNDEKPKTLARLFMTAFYFPIVQNHIVGPFGRSHLEIVSPRLPQQHDAGYDEYRD
jgi:hypothetical protein